MSIPDNGILCSCLIMLITAEAATARVLRGQRAVHWAGLGFPRAHCHSVGTSGGPCESGAFAPLVSLLQSRAGGPRLSHQPGSRNNYLYLENHEQLKLSPRMVCPRTHPSCLLVPVNSLVTAQGPPLSSRSSRPRILLFYVADIRKHECSM